jgi:hypothetical protein
MTFVVVDATKRTAGHAVILSWPRPIARPGSIQLRRLSLGLLLPANLIQTSCLVYLRIPQFNEFA